MKNFERKGTPVYRNEVGDPVTNVGDSKVTAEGGSTFIDGTNAVTGNFYAFIPNASTVINTVYKTAVGSATSTHIAKSDITGKTIAAGMYISAGRIGLIPAYFDSIQLTSGSVIAYSL
jgi:hypothetical protein